MKERGLAADTALPTRGKDKYGGRHCFDDRRTTHTRRPATRLEIVLAGKGRERDDLAGDEKIWREPHNAPRARNNKALTPAHTFGSGHYLSYHGVRKIKSKHPTEPTTTKPDVISSRHPLLQQWPPQWLKSESHSELLMEMFASRRSGRRRRRRVSMFESQNHPVPQSRRRCHREAIP